MAKRAKSGTSTPLFAATQTPISATKTDRALTAEGLTDKATDESEFEGEFEFDAREAVRP